MGKELQMARQFKRMGSFFFRYRDPTRTQHRLLKRLGSVRVTKNPDLRLQYENHVCLKLDISFNSQYPAGQCYTIGP